MGENTAKKLESLEIEQDTFGVEDNVENNIVDSQPNSPQSSNYLNSCQEEGESSPSYSKISTSLTSILEIQDTLKETLSPPKVPLHKVDTPLEEIMKIAEQGIDILGESYIDGRWTASNLDDLMAKIFSGSLSSRESNTATKSKDTAKNTTQDSDEEITTVRGSLGSRLNLARIKSRVRILRYLVQEKLINLQRGARGLEVAHRHYDLGNDLFEAMLDRSMTYTSGVWTKADTLEDAQSDKLKLLCDKLQLQPQMTLLDIGCGWGNFAEYAAKEYGVAVTGITISSEQAKFARKRCSGLPVTIIEQDYRKVNGKFDRVVSIEMIEAVGRKNLGTFFYTVNRCLKKDGLFALQAISAETVTKFSCHQIDEFLLWILKYIFPNGYLPTLPQLMTPARSSFVLEDMENLGNSYEKTLLSWEKNFRESWDTLSTRYDERFFRMWRFYLLSCAALFRIRMTNVYQLVYRKL